MAFTGRCLCEGVQFELTEAPTMMGSCHCTRCQRAAGAGHTPAVVSSIEHLKINQGSELLQTYSEEGFSDRVFCSKCGSSIYGQAGEMVFIGAGLFHEDPGLRPQFHMMVAFKAPWEEIHDELPQFPEYPPMG